MMTRAKLTLDESLQHLHHFCNSLSPVQYTSMNPVFAYDRFPDRLVRCRVTLPNGVGMSTRSFASSCLWKSERLARADAAFNACEALHGKGLINDNLMPHLPEDEETKRVYSTIEKRPNVVQADSQLNVWADLAQSWADGDQLFASTMAVLINDEICLEMATVLPARLQDFPEIQLHLDQETDARIMIQNGVPIVMDQEHVEMANRAAHRILDSIFRNRMGPEQTRYPVLFYPCETDGNLQDWLTKTEGSLTADQVLQSIDAGAVSLDTLGLVRLKGQDYHPYNFHGAEEVHSEDAESEAPQLMLKVTKFSRNTDLSQFTVENGEKRYHFLNIGDCSVDKLPCVYARFARIVPRIMHHIQRSLVADLLCDNELRSVQFFDRSLVLQAITSPAASGVSNYERLEFLGDTVLKLYTSVNALAQNRVKMEGYLSKWKDHTVSNKSLAVISKGRLHLDKYLLTSANSFKPSKWRPPTNECPPVIQESGSISTKTLADGVEALLGAAFLDGGEPRALDFLRLCFPQSTWSSLIDSCSLVADFATSGDTFNIPADFIPLETLLGHKFSANALLLEALTHPSYLSQSGNPSYQRLEFLGDAVLDFVINKSIFHSTPGLPPSYMTTLRHAVANRHFLAFFLHASNIETPMTRVISPTQYTGKAANIETSAKRRSILDFLRHTGNLELTAELAAFKERFSNLKPSISAELQSGPCFPWMSLTALAAPKVVSDLLESVLGALAVDAKGDLAPCEAWLEKLGILPWLRRALADDVDVTHPKARLHLLLGKMRYDGRINYILSSRTVPEDSDTSEQAAQTNEKPELSDDPIALLLGPRSEVRRQGGRQKRTCRIILGEHEICASDGYDKATAIAAAAEEAVRKLQSEDWSEVLMKHDAQKPVTVEESDEIMDEDEKSPAGNEGHQGLIEEEEVEEEEHEVGEDTRAEERNEEQHKTDANGISGKKRKAPCDGSEKTAAEREL